MNRNIKNETVTFRSISTKLDRSTIRSIETKMDRSKNRSIEMPWYKIKTDYLQSIKIKHKIYTIKQNEWGASQER
jgi:hypothetical protein